MNLKVSCVLYKNIKVSCFKSSENIKMKTSGSHCTVSNNKFSSVTLNELAMKARESILLFRASIRQPQLFSLTVLFCRYIGVIRLNVG